MSAKKHLTFSLTLCTAMLLTACAGSENPSIGDTSSIINSDVSSTTSEPQNSGDTENSGNPEPGNVPDTSWLPRMDGSTSASPLEIGLKSGFLGISYNDAKELVSHTTTHDSFKRLISGEVDLILSVPISAEQQAAADEAGVKLTMEPVAREGFVFVVNASNPVSSLTQDQLRKIYSGEITNWKELGGNDEPILPYQRNTDSGSQNYMTVFMGDTGLISPKTDLVAVGMGGLMDAIAVYDNSAGAIGYSVYSYAAQMYANANKVKFIAVDGIEPSKATMADESYPLLSCTYAIYTDKSADSARKFTEKILSDEGQMLVLESGYLPVNGMEVPAKYLPYEAVGTGEPRPAGFVRPEKYSQLRSYDPELFKTVQKNDRTYFEITFLKDKELQSRINADIGAALDRLREYSVPKYGNKNCTARIDGIGIDLDIKNGYLSLQLGYDDPDHYGYWSGTYCYYHAETLCYDLFSGKKLENLSDMFWKGENFLPEVNTSISEFINQALTFDAEESYYSGIDLSIDQKLDFSGLLGEQRPFTLDYVGFEPDNLYFSAAPFIKFNNENSVIQQFRDMTEIVSDEYKNSVINYDRYYPEWETKQVRENDEIYLHYTGSIYHAEAEVKARDELCYELQKRAWEFFRKYRPDYSSRSMVNIHDTKNCISVGHQAFDADSDVRVCFDAETHEIITMEKLLGENWQQYLEDKDIFKHYLGEDHKDLADFGLYPSHWWSSSDENTVNVYVYPTKSESALCGNIACFSVPKDKLNSRYLPEN